VKRPTNKNEHLREAARVQKQLEREILPQSFHDLTLAHRNENRTSSCRHGYRIQVRKDCLPRRPCQSGSSSPCWNDELRALLEVTGLRRISKESEGYEVQKYKYIALVPFVKLRGDAVFFRLSIRH